MTRPSENPRRWAGVRRVFRLPFSSARLDADVDAELRFHLEGRVEELMRSEGLSRSDAEAEAHRRFGDYARYHRAARDIDQNTHQWRRRMEIRASLARELRQSARSLRRTPIFSLIAVVTLALGLGAATATFSLLDAVVLRPLPYPAADRLVSLSSPVPRLKGQTRWGLARHEMFYFLQNGHTLQDLGVYQTDEGSVRGNGAGEQAERVRAVQASASLLNVLGFKPLYGRLILREENSQQQPTVALLGHDFWMRRFAGDSAVVGQVLNVEGLPLTIVGVLPQGAQLPDLRVDLWVPAWVDSTTVWNNHTWSAIGLLNPGYTAEDAERDLAPLTARLEEAFPQVYRGNFVESTGFRTEVVSLRDAVVGDLVTRALWALFGAVALVLLIAAANIANLSLVRIDARRRDVAVRTALGAGRGHLTLHYLVEGMLIAAPAAVGALLFGQGMLRVIVALAPTELPRLSEVGMHGASVAFTLCLALLAALLLGLLPHLGTRLDLAALHDSSRSVSASRRRMALRRVLVATQMAFAVVLLASAGLMVRTYRNLQGIRPGFDAAGVLTMEIALPRAEYGGSGDAYLASAVKTSGLFEQVAQRLRSLPGVVGVGFTTRLPLVSGDWCTGITLQGPTPEAMRGTCPPVAAVSPGYFEAMGTRVQGRTLDWSGMNANDGAMVVSKAFADHHWPNESPIGKGIRFQGGRDNPVFYRVVGVAENVHGIGVDAPPTEDVYFPIRPLPEAPLWGVPITGHLVVKTALPNPGRLGAAVARVVRELEPGAAIANVASMETMLARSMARRSFTMVLLGIAAALALLLSAVGIYGVISYIVAQRRGEIGVRMALGARTRHVTGMVLSQSLGLAVIGVVVGLVAALGTTRVLSALLYGVAPTDPLTLAVVPLVLLAVALVASYLPARRAARTDPVLALRAE